MLTTNQRWALLALTLMWGVNWPVMKLSLQELSPLFFRALTMTGGALSLALLFHHRGIRLRPARTEWRSIVTLALPNVLGWHTLAIFGVQALASGRAAILGFTMPVWTVLLGAWFFKNPLTRRSVLATGAVVLAVALLLSDEWTNLSGRPVGVGVMLAAAMSWALGTLWMRRAHLTLPVEALTVWMMGLTSGVLWVLALVFEPWPTWHFSPRMWGLLSYSVFLNYGYAQIIWFSLARHLPPTTSAMSVMAIPLIGAGSATVLAGESPHWQDGVAALCVVVAIATVLLPGRQQRG